MADLGHFFFALFDGLLEFLRTKFNNTVHNLLGNQQEAANGH